MYFFANPDLIETENKTTTENTSTSTSLNSLNIDLQEQTNKILKLEQTLIREKELAVNHVARIKDFEMETNKLKKIIDENEIEKKEG